MWLFVLTLKLLLELTKTQIFVSPLNRQSIIGATFTENNQNDSFKNAQINVLLPAFSYSEIWIDLRHIGLTEDQSYMMKASVGNLTSKLTFTQGKANKYSLFAPEQISFKLFVQINTSKPEIGIFSNSWKYFIDTASIKNTKSNLKNLDESKDFVWVIDSLSQISIPLNAPNLTQSQTLESKYFFKNIEVIMTENNTLPSSTKQEMNYAQYWSNINQIVVPFVPYFSNCSKTGSNIYLMKEAQDPKWCNIVPEDSINPVNELLFGTSPYADSCTMEFECIYDQDFFVQSEYPYWMTLPSGVNLMQITKDRMESADYLINSSKQAELVDCVIEQSEGNNQSNRFPTTVEVSLNYYQVTKNEYHMISCTIKYGLYTDAVDNLNYTLTIKKKPLNHTYILIAFGFNSHVYIIAFILIGLISNVENITLALYHYVANKHERKPLKVKIYFQVMKGMFHGALSAVIPLLALIALINVIMSGNIFGKVIYSLPPENGVAPVVIWDQLSSYQFSDYTASEPSKLRSGRHGIALFTISACIMYILSERFIGIDKKRQDYNEFSVVGLKCVPIVWLKGRFILSSFIYIILQLMLMYFAYTQFYSDNIWVFIVFTKVLQMVLQQITMNFLNDIIQCSPMKTITDFTSYLNTLAANNFYDFMFSFLIDVALNMCDKAYIASLQNIITEKIKDKLTELSAYIENIINDEEEEQKQVSKEDDIGDNDEEDKEVYIAYGTADISFDETQEDYNQCSSDVSEDESQEIYKKQLAEVTQTKLKGEVKKEILHEHLEQEEKQRLQLKNTELQFTADMFNMPLALILQPFAIFILWLTYDESQILTDYIIPEKFTSIYLLSAVFIGLFTIVNMVVLFFLLQNYHGLNIEEYIINMLERFINRKQYWKPDEGDIDNDYETPLRSTYNYCLSSQFYFILTLYVSAMFLMVVGICTMIGQGYNPFSDLANLWIIAFWLVLTTVYWFLAKEIAKKFNIWEYNRFYGEKQNKVYPRVSENIDVIKQQKQDSKNENIEVDDSVDNVTMAQFFRKEDLAKKEQAFQAMRKASDELSLSSFPLSSNKEIVLKNKIDIKQKFDKPIDVHLNKFDDKIEQMRLLQIKVKTICKKLEPRFDDQSFRLSYALKNKEYIKKHIQKIISSVEHLPQIPQQVLNYDNQSHHEEEQTLKKLVISEQTRSLLSVWMNETQKDRDTRKLRGIQIEKSIKRCRFCYNNWGIYYGYGGICLQCNEELIKSKQD